MIFEEKKITLKDGRECVLCPTGPQYAEEMIEYLKITSGETPFLLRYPDEVNYTLEKEREILGRMLEDERWLMMVAIVDGVLAGNCSIVELGGFRKISHRCEFAIALKKEYWSVGIGSAMMDYAFKLAKQIGFELVELDYIEGNESGRRLYEKHGFVETGRKLKAFKYDDGTYRDAVLMTKILE